MEGVCGWDKRFRLFSFLVLSPPAPRAWWKNQGKSWKSGKRKEALMREHLIFSFTRISSFSLYQKISYPYLFFYFTGFIFLFGHSLWTKIASSLLFPVILSDKDRWKKRIAALGWRIMYIEKRSFDLCVYSRFSFFSLDLSVGMWKVQQQNHTFLFTSRSIFSFLFPYHCCLTVISNGADGSVLSVDLLVTGGKL